MKYEISKEKLVAILELAFEEGCYGYLDLKSSVIEKIMDDLQLVPTFSDPVFAESSLTLGGNVQNHRDGGTQNVFWEDYNNADETTLIRADITGAGTISSSTIVSNTGNTIRLADLDHSSVDTSWMTAGDG